MADVLVVDDDGDIRSLLELALQLDGHDVVTVAGGGEALDALRDEGRQGRARVVVLDVQMPDLDGWQVLRLIRSDEQLRDTPVMLCTVRASAADLARGWVAGCDAYQPKPFDIAAVSAELDLLATTPIDELWRRRRARAQGMA
jgi:CheY-like chemotaxis protein